MEFWNKSFEIPPKVGAPSTLDPTQRPWASIRFRKIIHQANKALLVRCDIKKIVKSKLVSNPITTLISSECHCILALHSSPFKFIQSCNVWIIFSIMAELKWDVEFTIE